MDVKELNALKRELLQMRLGMVPADMAATAARIEAAIDNLHHRLFLAREATRMETAISAKAYISDGEED